MPISFDKITKLIEENDIKPWRPKEKGVARMFCDIVTPDGKPFAGDPR